MQSGMCEGLQEWEAEHVAHVKLVSLTANMRQTKLPCARVDLELPH